jgi:hypothetical protein
MRSSEGTPGADGGPDPALQVILAVLDNLPGQVSGEMPPVRLTAWRRWLGQLSGLRAGLASQVADSGPHGGGIGAYIVTADDWGHLHVRPPGRGARLFVASFHGQPGVPVAVIAAEAARHAGQGAR